MKVSVCITVFNEKKTTEKLLEALCNQSKKPDEIVIVDGGSTDNTVSIIKNFQEKYSFIRLLVKKSNIAQGRNLSISLAKNEIIATTDGGCIPHSDWLEKITRFFKHKEVDIVAGFYDMPYSSPIGKIISCFLGIPEERFDYSSFLPSVRSAAFRKKVWENLGGFNEELGKGGDDTFFFVKAASLGMKIVRAKDAKVLWEEVSTLNLKDFFKKVFNHAKGDLKSGIWIHPTKGILSHNIKNLTIFLRYFVFLFAFYLMISSQNFYLFWILIFLYFFWSVWKWRDVVFGKDRFYIPLVQVVSDFGVMAGFLSALLEKLLKAPKKFINVKI